MERLFSWCENFVVICVMGSNLRHVMTPISMTHNNFSNNYCKITYESRLESLSQYCHRLLSLCVFVVSGVDDEAIYVLCGSHETGWSGCACSLAQIRPLLCATYSTGLDHQYAPHARERPLHWQQAALLSEWRLSDVITLWGRRGCYH